MAYKIEEYTLNVTEPTTIMTVGPLLGVDPNPEVFKIYFLVNQDEPRQMRRYSTKKTNETILGSPTVASFVASRIYQGETIHIFDVTATTGW